MSVNNCCGDNCSRCGHCCTMCIPISRKEEKCIRNYIKENNIEPEDIITDDTFYVRCCFYDAENKCCKIYPVRPAICRSYKCNRNEDDLEREKIVNHNRAYWNHIGADGKIHNITSFDMLFYNNPEPLLRLMLYEMCGGKSPTMADFIRIKKLLREFGLSDLADSLIAEG